MKLWPVHFTNSHSDNFHGLGSDASRGPGSKHPKVFNGFLQHKAQAEALAQQAEEARLAELESIITTMREQIAEYGITADQLFGRRRAVASNPRTPIAPKYRDPKSGATWSGRGKAPQWIASARNRDKFLIPEAE